MKVVLLKIY